MATDMKSSSSVNTKQKAGLTGMAFTGVANLIKLLPTGTVFLFQFLSPVLTNNGKCHPINKLLTGILLGVSGLSCFFSCFTDSFKGSDGSIHYGFVTINGLWTSSGDSKSMNLSSYKLRVSDFAHAFVSLMVFVTVALLDSNTMSCYYDSFESTQHMLVTVLPTVVGTIASAMFAFFPTDRHGIGYPSSEASTAQDSSSDLPSPKKKESV